MRWLLPLVALVACKGPDEPAGESVSGTITATDGGVIEANDGSFRFEVPAGALSEDVEVTITVLEEAGGALAGRSSAFDLALEPSGLSFAEPALLEFFPSEARLESLLLEEGDIPTLALADGNGAVELVPSAFQDNGGFSVLVPHFSWASLTNYLSGRSQTSCLFEGCKVGHTSRWRYWIRNDHDARINAQTIVAADDGLDIVTGFNVYYPELFSSVGGGNTDLIARVSANEEQRYSRPFVCLEEGVHNIYWTARGSTEAGYHDLAAIYDELPGGIKNHTGVLTVGVGCIEGDPERGSAVMLSELALADHDGSTWVFGNGTVTANVIAPADTTMDAFEPAGGFGWVHSNVPAWDSVKGPDSISLVSSEQEVSADWNGSSYTVTGMLAQPGFDITDSLDVTAEGFSTAVIAPPKPDPNVLLGTPNGWETELRLQGDHVSHLYVYVAGEGGEGVMIRRPIWTLEEQSDGTFMGPLLPAEAATAYTEAGWTPSFIYVAVYNEEPTWDLFPEYPESVPIQAGRMYQIQPNRFGL